MQATRVRFCLLRLRCARGVPRDSKSGQRWQKLSYGTGPSKPDPKVLALRDKLLYCEYLDHEITKMGYLRRRKIQKAREDLEGRERYEMLAHRPVFSVTLTDRLQEEAKEIVAQEEKEENDAGKWPRKPKPVHMPYATVDSYEITNSTAFEEDEDDDYGEGEDENEDEDEDEEDEMRKYERHEKLVQKYLAAKEMGRGLGGRFEVEGEEGSRPKGELWKVPYTWMCDYEEFDDALLSTAWYNGLGTPKPDTEVSSVQCGGCGALLHCKDPAVPGYLPSELFCGREEKDLKAMVCQRCHFLKCYNAALDVRVSAADYPKLLSVIKRKKCAVILMVDLTDFPCSIWPGLKSILHPFTPVFLVGNKVDLLPRDSPRFFEHVQQVLLDTVLEATGVNRANVTHVQLTSAKTGYGIEQLINKLQHKWRYKGDVYLIGCTNVGKSSLFNALLNSDYCKVQAVDTVPRATVSAWPGTTLDLLKFPILHPSGRKVWMRVQRLQRESLRRMQEAKHRDNRFSASRKIEDATLEDRVGRTFSANSLEDETADPFAERSPAFMTRRLVFDENDPEYERSRWCFDTPGTVHSEQVLDLLTTDELLLTVPRRIISPRTFSFRPQQTVFVAGMGRLDYLEGEYFIRCTVFASSELPITICRTEHADELYQQLLETEAFVVPSNDPERLKAWPRLESRVVKATGLKNLSAADVVLSSIGWIAVTAHENETVSLRAWTPQGRGIWLRRPALLASSVNLRGPKVHGSPMYFAGRQVYVKQD